MIYTLNLKNIKHCFFFGIIALLLSSFSGLAGQKPPNIIFILADDLSYRDLSCYGQQRYKTPNLDQLAIHGIRFTQAYAAAPECAPSRCSLMTGLHTGHSTVRINSSARGQDHLLDSDVTIAEVLKKAGYNTGFTGKWGIGQQGTEGVPYKQGFDYAFGYYDQTEAHTYIPYYLFENEKMIEYPENKGFNMSIRYNYKNNEARNSYDSSGKLFIPELKNPYGYTYSENEIQKAAFKFLDRNNPNKTQKPFFLYYATQLPHGPVIVDNLGEMAQPDSVLQMTREWAAMVIKLDEFVGKLVSYLKETGQFENTVVFFASDNGYSMPGYFDRGNAPFWPDDPWLKNKGPFSGGKFSVMEGGIRVPFFVSCPAKFKPAVYNQPVWLPDFFPTACELAGLNPTKQKTDGLSLLPFLKNTPEKFAGHEYLYFSKAREQAIRMGSWKAYRKNPDSKTELYLVEEDTYTERDMAWLYPEIAKKATSLMDNSYTESKWYWNPNETAAEYQEKVKLAQETNNLLPVYRPNEIQKFSWEKD